MVKLAYIAIRAGEIQKSIENAHLFIGADNVDMGQIEILQLENKIKELTGLLNLEPLGLHKKLNALKLRKERDFTHFDPA